MRVTVCELPDDNREFKKAWDKLIEHVKNERSELIILPEMPAYLWFPKYPNFDEDIWQKAIKSHDDFIKNLKLQTTVISTRPIQKGKYRLNQAFFLDRGRYYPIRAKYYLPNEEWFYETTWFHRGKKDFSIVRINNILVGILICSELMFNEWARLYGKQKAHIIAVPRATEKSTINKWLIASQMASIVSGAYVLSSNRVSGIFGGRGWVISPEGEVIAITSEDEPFVTVDIDLKEAELAKQRYPRYIPE
ncbi:carbon-nitrogen hydrolase family protein [Methanotorris formicicus]|uniref:Nitrilase/cyanide hydratase and apolipoprotein N-acyltransferase n=1 Tax=Methanotorris formicicus Mc-S-70 TaxID=647171 RepID=H1L024_9EURY|nr:carbon-nitrogen hydrolase family protein [Methanotorris formicicus]EHP85244.1 Nitrilase/cyanide hydratase and apolipoprotein N-acyltransferase [Methanotorris formicicus Mc-S-70]